MRHPMITGQARCLLMIVQGLRAFHFLWIKIIRFYSRFILETNWSNLACSLVSCRRCSWNWLLLKIRLKVSGFEPWFLLLLLYFLRNFSLIILKLFTFYELNILWKLIGFLELFNFIFLNIFCLFKVIYLSFLRKLIEMGLFMSLIIILVFNILVKVIFNLYN